MVAASDVGRLASCAVMRYHSCWLSAFVLSLFSCRAVCPIVFSFLVFLSYSSYFVSGCKWSGVLAGIFIVRVFFAVHCMAKSPCRIILANVYLCLVVCEYSSGRARLSMRHRHGHWLCWVQMGGNSSLMRRTHTVSKKHNFEFVWRIDCDVSNSNVGMPAARGEAINRYNRNRRK